MNIFKRIFSPYLLDEVFTPNTVAKLTYVKRKTLEEDLEKYITLPGKQIFLYGHSGSGKTTIVRNLLMSLNRNYIRTHCESATTFNDLLLQAFDSLDRFYVSEKTSNSSYSIKADLKAEYGVIKAKISEKSTVSNGERLERVVPVQLTPQKLTTFLGEIDCLWIIEDFHKVEATEKKRIADVVKIFIDSANDYSKVKIVCIGAVGTARELVEFDDNLSNRVAEVYVPLLTDKEIKAIINKGSSLLHLSMSEELKTKIIYYSNNLASLAHQICYDICYDKNVKKSCLISTSIADESFKVAVESFIRKNSDTFAKLYESIVATDCGWPILKAFEHSEKEYLSIGEIRHTVNTQNRDKGKLSQSALEAKLEILGTQDFSGLIRFDRNSKKYSITTPFFRAFLKMKMALEKSELKERNNKKKKKRLNEYSITSKGKRLVIDEEFMSNYYQLLDSYIIREQTYRAKRKK